AGFESAATAPGPAAASRREGRQICTPDKEVSLAVTKSWEEAEDLSTSQSAAKPRAKRRKLTFPGAIWLLLSSLVVAGGLEMVYSAKIYRQHETSTPQTAPLNLNTVTSADQITPYLQFYPSPSQRDEVAGAL